MRQPRAMLMRTQETRSAAGSGVQSSETNGVTTISLDDTHVDGLIDAALLNGGPHGGISMGPYQ